MAAGECVSCADGVACEPDPHASHDTTRDVTSRGAHMIINPGKHRPQGPWDPNEKKRYFDTSEAWLWLPLLALVGAVVAAVYFLG